MSRISRSRDYLRERWDKPINIILFALLLILLYLVIAYFGCVAGLWECKYYNFQYTCFAGSIILLIISVLSHSLYGFNSILYHDTRSKGSLITTNIFFVTGFAFFWASFVLDITIKEPNLGGIFNYASMILAVLLSIVTIITLYHSEKANKESGTYHEDFMSFVKMITAEIVNLTRRIENGDEELVDEDIKIWIFTHNPFFGSVTAPYEQFKPLNDYLHIASSPTPTALTKHETITKEYITAIEKYNEQIAGERQCVKIICDHPEVLDDYHKTFLSPESLTAKPHNVTYIDNKNLHINFTKLYTKLNKSESTEVNENEVKLTWDTHGDFLLDTWAVNRNIFLDDIYRKSRTKINCNRDAQVHYSPFLPRHQYIIVGTTVFQFIIDKNQERGGAKVKKNRMFKDKKQASFFEEDFNSWLSWINKMKAEQSSH